MQVLTQILSHGATSKLYRTLVERQKIAAWVHVRYDPTSTGPTYLSVSAQPNPGKTVEELEKAVGAEIKNVVNQGITESELKKAKKRILISIAYSKDHAFAGSDEFGRALTGGRTINDIESWPERIEAVTLKDINQAAQTIFSNKVHVTSVLRPEVKNEPVQKTKRKAA